jgi:nucleotide-binding universal stress UspA family protein
MQEEFSRILSLVDFSKTSLHASEEAALIASKFNSELHLLHVVSNSDNIQLNGDDKMHQNNKERLEYLKTTLQSRYEIIINCHEVIGKVNEVVNKYSRDLTINLIVLPAKKETWFKELFFESTAKKIIRCVDSEVLCVYDGSISNKLKKIVLPIGKFIPKRKIRLAYELAKKFAANVHLISLNKNGSVNSEDTKILMASYQYLKDITNIPIECRTVPGDNLAQAAVHYAENIGADLILVNAGAESLFKRTVLQRWGGNIVNHSSIPVLSVHAINEKTHKQYRA